MENIRDPLKNYKQILTEGFQKILKLVPKKYKSFKDMIQKHTDQINQLNDRNQLSANKYYIILKMALDVHNAQLTQCTLYYLEKLVSHRFLDGNCFDYTQNVFLEEDEKQHQQQQQQQVNKNQKLIDTIVKSICDCTSLKDENVHVEIIKSLLTLSTSPICEISGQNLDYIIKTIFGIYCQSKQGILQNTSKHAISQIVSELFKKMEKNSFLSFEERQVYCNKKQNTQGYSGSPTREGSSSLTKQTPPISINIQQDDTPSSTNIQQTMLSQQQQMSFNNYNILPPVSLEDKKNQKNQLLNQYTQRVVQNLVDDVCMYFNKVEKITQKYSGPEEQQQLQQELSLIPIKCVPIFQDNDNPQYKRTMFTNIDNEKNIKAGKFGWCFVCRNEAQNFCKDTRVPICSKECKLKHLEEIQLIERVCFDNYTDGYLNKFMVDCLNVFEFLCKTSCKDASNNLSQVQLKEKALALELLLIIMEKGGPIFISRKEFIQAVKDYLLQSLLQNSLSTEKSVFIISFSIFACLIDNFRQNLKTEIGVFIENVFIKYLESPNANYNLRIYCLHVFNKIFKTPRAVIEMFVNYDCLLNQNNMIEHTIELLCKISQGKYAKPEFQNLIMHDQDLELRNLATKSVIDLMKGLVDFVDFFDEQQKQQQVATATLAVHTPQNEETNVDVTQTYEENTKDPIEEQRQRKLQFKKAIEKFNFKPKQGIKFLVDAQIIEKDNPKQLAEIFYTYNAQLDQEKLGEIFGSADAFSKSILAEFIEFIPFKDLDIVQGLRKFLTYFQLPGEGQQVDRILEKFGEKYVLDNPQAFKSATSAYTLSYALMMLQTSLHNQQVQEKDRMTYAQFQNLIKGVDDGESLPEDRVQAMYSEIRKAPLAIHHLEAQKKAFEEALTQSVSKKQEMFLLETEQMLEKSRLKMQSNKDSENIYISVFNKDYIRNLLQIIWSPVFACLSSQGIESNVNSQQIQDNQQANDYMNTINGFKYSIRLLGQFGLDTEKETFLLELSRQTGLMGGTYQKILKQKNIYAIKTLLEICTSNKYILGRSWKTILQCIGQLDHYFNVNLNSQKNTDLINSETYLQNNSSEQQQQDQIEIINAQVVANYIDQSMVDKIFHNSTLLDGESIVQFIRCLCEQSRDEIDNMQTPRMFCIQRIAEITEFNMHRVRIIWNRIWEVLKQYYNYVGCHRNHQISAIAIDSLKQLALKFLQIPELVHYQYQRDFLSPFEYVYSRVNTQDLKELILNCLQHMTHIRADNLRSGWKIVLKVVNATLLEDNQVLVDLAVSITDMITQQKSLDNLIDVYADLIHALTNQTKYKQEKIALKALDHLKKCIKFLVENTHKDDQQQQHHTIVVGNSKQSLIINESKRLLEGYLIPILNNFASFFSDERPSIIKKSVKYLFETIKQYSNQFNSEFWNLIFKGVVRPLFDDMQFTFQNMQYSNKLLYNATKITSHKAFQEFVSIYIQHFNTLENCMDEFLTIITNCVLTYEETLSSISLENYKQFLVQMCGNLNQNHWDKIIQTFQQISEACQPIELLNVAQTHEDFNISVDELTKKENIYLPQNTPELNFNKNIIQCVIFKNVLVFILDIFESFKQYLTLKHINTLIEVFNKHQVFTREFNKRIYLRFYLWRSGILSKQDKLIVLGRQEKTIRSSLVQLYYEKYTREKTDSNLNDFHQVCFNYIENLAVVVEERRKSLIQQRELQQQQQQLQQQQNEENQQLNTNYDVNQQQQQQQQQQLQKQQQETNQQNTIQLSDLLKQLEQEDRERELKQLRFVLENNVLPKMNDEETIQKLSIKQIKEITNKLVDISNQNIYIEDDFDFILKQTLQKYVNYVFTKIN